MEKQPPKNPDVLTPAQRYYQKNRARIIAKNRAYAVRNADKVREYRKRYREENKTKLTADRKAWYEANKEHVKENSRRWYAENKNRAKANSKRWKAENPQKMAAIRERQQETAAFIDEWKAQGCVVCGEDNPCCVDAHHLDPEQKSHKLNQLRNRKMETARAELEKCVPLCANCHRKLHAGLIELK